MTGGEKASVDPSGFVDHIVRSHVEEKSLGQVFREVAAVRLSARKVFMPDLRFYRTDRLHPLRETVIDGPPDLAVEVLSQRTADRDADVKLVEYEQHGVDEYWVPDPRTLAQCSYGLPRVGSRPG